MAIFRSKLKTALYVDKKNYFDFKVNIEQLKVQSSMLL